MSLRQDLSPAIGDTVLLVIHVRTGPMPAVDAKFNSMQERATETAPTVPPPAPTAPTAPAKEKAAR